MLFTLLLTVTQAAPATLEEFVLLSKVNADAPLSVLIERTEAGAMPELEAAFDKDPAAFLFLKWLKTLDPAQAAALSTFSGSYIVLPDLKSLDAPTAKALAAWRGRSLWLGGLASLGPGVAKALAAWPGEKLYLDGVVQLGAADAKALAAFRGKVLSLANAKVEPEAAKALAAFKGAIAVGVSPGKPRAPLNMTPQMREQLRTLSRQIDQGDEAAVKKYLDAGGTPDLNERGTTLLMEAVDHSQLGVATQLVKAGADVNAVNEISRTALSYALEGPPFAGAPGKDPKVQRALVRLLVEAGTNLNPAPTGDFMFKPPLVAAARLGDAEVLALLIKKGADLEGADSHGTTALYEAVTAGQVAAVKLLLGAKAKVPRNGKMLRQAVSMGASELSMARYTAKQKHGSVDPKQEAEQTKRWSSVLELLVKAGEPLGARDDRGWDALTTALNGADVELLDRVIALGADVKRADEQGETPLHFVARLSRVGESELVPLAKALLARGASGKVKNAKGETPVEIATGRKYTALAQTLAQN